MGFWGGRGRPFCCPSACFVVIEVSFWLPQGLCLPVSSYFYALLSCRIFRALAIIWDIGRACVCRSSLLKLLAVQPVEGRVHTSRGELSRAARSAAHAILLEGIHVPSDITNMCMFPLGFPGENRTQEENNCCRSKRPKRADFFGCVEVLNIVVC